MKTITLSLVINGHVYLFSYQDVPIFYNSFDTISLACLFIFYVV